MIVGDCAMTTLALQSNKNYTKLILYSAYAILLGFFIAPQKNILYDSAPTAYAATNNIQYGYISNSPLLEEEYILQKEKERWDNSVRQRYKNGAILTIHKGVKHIRLTKHTRAGNIKINVIEINKKLNPKLEVTPVLASSTLQNKATIKTLASKQKTIAAINATYFKPETGIPLGTLMIDKKLYTGPIYNRVALGITDEGYIVDKYKLNASLKYKKLSILIDNINQPRMLSTYTLIYTKDWGEKSPKAPQYGINLAIENGIITQISTTETTIPKNGFVVSGTKLNLEPFFNAQMKDENQKFITDLFEPRKITLEIEHDKKWAKTNHIISGGPYLIKNGEIFIDTKEEKLLAITGRNPRTAVGFTENNEFILITIDGREKNSIGMTLNETANLMHDFGCTWAINLDGGGSSVMLVKGEIANSPNQKGGIAISNALVIKES